MMKAVMGSTVKFSVNGCQFEGLVVNIVDGNLFVAVLGYAQTVGMAPGDAEVVTPTNLIGIMEGAWRNGSEEVLRRTRQDEVVETTEAPPVAFPWGGLEAETPAPAESTFEGEGGRFGGAGATGSWDPPAESSVPETPEIPSVESSNTDSSDLSCGSGSDA